MKDLDPEVPLRGRRILTLRNLEGLTQGELAQQLGVTQGFVSQLERGLKPFTLQVAEKMAECFGFPVSFFAAPPQLTEAGFATFRKASRATSKEESRVLAHFGEAARLFDQASRLSGFHAADLPSLYDLDERRAAERVRRAMGLDEKQPVLNVTRALERLGVGVVDNLVEESNVDSSHSGVSRPSSFVDRPLIATLGNLPPAVARLTKLHELGHLIFDRERAVPIRGTRSPEEKRAFRFAASVLIPPEVIRERISESMTLHSYLPVKAEYGVSVSAIIQNACELRVISTQRKRSLFIQLSSQGWRREEPVSVAGEQPLLLSQAVEHGIAADAESVSERLGIRAADVVRWTGLPEKPEARDLAKIISFPHRQM